jgi:hypothetical protein
MAVKITEFPSKLPRWGTSSAKSRQFLAERFPQSSTPDDRNRKYETKHPGLPDLAATRIDKTH